MKKHILTAAAIGLLAAGGAMAQPNNLQPGDPAYGGQIYGNSGWTPDQAYGGQNVWVYPNIISQSQILRDGRYVVPGYYGSQYERSRRDRDGDGIRNNRDRYPDDPRYR